MSTPPPVSSLEPAGLGVWSITLGEGAHTPLTLWGPDSGIWSTVGAAAWPPDWLKSAALKANPDWAGHVLFGGTQATALKAGNDIEVAAEAGAGAAPAVCHLAFRKIDAHLWIMFARQARPPKSAVLPAAASDHSLALDRELGRLRQGIEQSKEGFALTDSRGCFTYMNPAHFAIFGFAEIEGESEDVIGMSWEMLYAPEEIAFIKREVFPSLIEKGSWSGHLLARRIDGTPFMEDLTLSLLPDGGIACNCRDRTEEVAARKYITQQDQLIRDFTERVPFGVVIVNDSGRVAYANKIGSVALGEVSGTLTGRQLAEAGTGHVVRQLAEIGAELDGAGHVAPRDLCSAIGGEPVIYEVCVFRLPTLGLHGDLRCYVLADVTERRRLERESRDILKRKSELLAMQREFIAMVSHEFRTPIASLQGALHLLRKGGTTLSPAKVIRYMDIQEDAVRVLCELVDQVLLLNRIDQHTGTPELEPTDLSALVAMIAKRVNDSLSTPRIELSLPAPEKRRAVPVEPALLRSAVENLLSNALKYSAADQPVMIALSHRIGATVIAVQDQGLGVPAAEQERLFQTFFRASNVGSVPGTGLGLRIVKNAMQLHGGEVRFRSEVGCGSTFELILPNV